MNRKTIADIQDQVPDFKTAAEAAFFVAENEEFVRVLNSLIERGGLSPDGSEPGSEAYRYWHHGINWQLYDLGLILHLARSRRDELRKNERHPDEAVAHVISGLKKSMHLAVDTIVALNDANCKLEIEKVTLSEEKQARIDELIEELDTLKRRYP